MSLNFRPHGDSTYIYYEYYSNGKKKSEYLGKKGTLNHDRLVKCLRELTPAVERSLRSYVEVTLELPEHERTEYLKRLASLIPKEEWRRLQVREEIPISVELGKSEQMGTADYRELVYELTSFKMIRLIMNELGPRRRDTPMKEIWERAKVMARQAMDDNPGIAQRLIEQWAKDPKWANEELEKLVANRVELISQMRIEQRKRKPTSKNLVELESDTLNVATAIDEADRKRNRHGAKQTVTRDRV